ncbi:MAG: SDR family oxidoreductase [Pseudomonadota bacterium]
MKLENRTVVVTGANRGIGRAIVEALLTRGVKKVYAAARKPQSLPDFGDHRVVPLALDVTDDAQVKAAANEASDADLLINNAGRAAFANALEADEALLRADMDTNYFGTLKVMTAFVPVLEGKAQAAIANVASIAAFVNFPGLGGYSASKAALFSISQGLRMTLQGRGISVHTINPGPIDTDMAESIEMDKTSPQDAANNILDGLEQDVADIFPDAVAAQMIDVWKGDYRALEAMVAQMNEGA